MVRADDHQARLLLRGHTADEVDRPFLGAPAPVLVGVELAVAVEVAELQSVPRDEAPGPGAKGRLNRCGGSHDPTVSTPA